MNNKVKKQNITNDSNVPVMKIKLESEKIWDDIKDMKLEMFALPGQLVSNYYKPMVIDPNKLYLTPLTTASSVVSILNELINDKYHVEQIDRFVVISNKILK